MSENHSEQIRWTEDDVASGTEKSLLREQKTKPRRQWKKVAIGLLLLIFLCCLLFAGFAAWGSKKVSVEKSPIETTLDSFMSASAARNVDAAYALFSPRTQRRLSKDDFEASLEGKNFVIFDGYKRLTVNNINISKTVNTNSDMPQGTVAKVNGTADYEGNFVGRFDAVLEKINDHWMIYAINITVPPDKF